MPYWQPFAVKAGQVLKLGGVTGPGMRAYLAVRGGIDVPDYLGSRVDLHARQVRRPWRAHAAAPATCCISARRSPRTATTAALAADLQPRLTHAWDIGVLYGPHGAPDFFTAGVHRHVLRRRLGGALQLQPTGVRLIGPKPSWARADGGEAGLHPCNIHDNAYAIGTIDFTGDMPIILGPDGPSLRRLRLPGHHRASRAVEDGPASPRRQGPLRASHAGGGARRLAQQDAEIAALEPVRSAAHCRTPSSAPTIASSAFRDATADTPRVVYRRAGDAYLLVEYGPIVLDLALRFRVHALMQAVERPSNRSVSPASSI